MGDALNLVNEYLDYLFTFGTVWVYLVILAACLVENIFPPFPGDTFILAAGGLVALDRLDLFLSMAAVAGGGLLSVMALFYLGRARGRDYFCRKNFKYFSTTDIGRVERLLGRWGALILTFSRFVVGFRSALALGAGIARYNPTKMLMYSTFSYVIFAGPIFYLADRLVANIDRIDWYLRTYSAAAWSIVIGVLIVYCIHRFMVLKKNR